MIFVVVTMAALACFCAIAGYLLSFVQQVLASLAEIRKSLDYLAQTTKSLADLPPPVAAGTPPLPAGLYMPESINGVTRLTPLVDNKNG